MSTTPSDKNEDLTLEEENEEQNMTNKKDDEEGNKEENEEEEDEEDEDEVEDSDDDVPPEVKTRLDYLRSLETERARLEEEYVKEKILLLSKYKALYEPLYVKRNNIVNGIVDVRKLPRPEGEGEEEVPSSESYEEFNAPEGGENGEGAIGIPNFWVQTMVSNESVSSMISEDDVAALEYISDVKCFDNDDMTGFTLEFHFKPNPYFSNEVLTKSYTVPNLALEIEPFLEKSSGCTINWKSGKNLTQEEKRYKNRNKKKGQQVKIKIVEKESFFNFFKTLPFPNDEDLDEEEFEDEDDLLQRHKYDFMIANILRTRVVPKALLYYTGEEVDDDYYDFETDDDEDDEDEDDDDEDNEDDEEEEYKPGGRRTRNSKKTADMVKASDLTGGLGKVKNNEECKQS